jgi:hypothetical protein
MIHDLILANANVLVRLIRWAPWELSVKTLLVFCSDDGIVEEISEAGRLRQLSIDPNMILLGNNRVFYRDALKRNQLW